MACHLLTHRHGWTLDDVGKEVDLPTGNKATLTVEMVDSGLDALHRYVSDECDGNHGGIRGLQRLPAGSHGVWEPHMPEMTYKLIEAAEHVGLAVLIFDLAQKSRYTAHVALASSPPTRKSSRTTRLARRPMW